MQDSLETWELQDARRTGEETPLEPGLIRCYDHIVHAEVHGCEHVGRNDQVLQVPLRPTCRFFRLRLVVVVVFGVLLP